MDRISIKNENSGKSMGADVLSKSDKKIRCVIDGMDVAMTFTRTDVRKPYICHMGGITLQTDGKNA